MSHTPPAPSTDACTTSGDTPGASYGAYLHAHHARAPTRSERVAALQSFLDATRAASSPS